MYVLAQTYVDVAALAALPRGTGGQLYTYLGFNPAHDGAKLYNDLRWNAMRYQGMEVSRNRCCSQPYS